MQKDELPLAGINYYRIKAYNADGSAIYSKIVKVLPKAMISSITVYPNPVVERNIFIKFQNQPVGKYKAESGARLGMNAIFEMAIMMEISPIFQWRLCIGIKRVHSNYKRTLSELGLL